MCSTAKTTVVHRVRRKGCRVDKEGLAEPLYVDFTVEPHGRFILIFHGIASDVVPVTYFNIYSTVYMLETCTTLNDSSNNIFAILEH